MSGIRLRSGRVVENPQDLDVENMPQPTDNVAVGEEPHQQQDEQQLEVFDNMMPGQQQQNNPRNGKSELTKAVLLLIVGLFLAFLMIGDKEIEQQLQQPEQQEEPKFFHLPENYELKKTKKGFVVRVVCLIVEAFCYNHYVNHN